jgi:filamentous hemagglutinin family protein
MSRIVVLTAKSSRERYRVALRGAAFIVAMCSLAALLPRAAAAQHITIAGGVSRAHTLVGPNYLIGPNLGKQVGGNLFDSFVSFSVAKGESAIFASPARIKNIIAGVTGGDPSTINGSITSRANLYLINPDGIVFGPHATVNVSGSFYASTADYLRLGRNGRFEVTHPDGSKLNAAPPTAFGFLITKPAKITVDGSMLTPPGTIGLVGGPVAIRRGALIKAPGGSIDVASVAGKGEVPVEPGNARALSVKRFGRVDVSGGSVLEVDDPSGRAQGDSLIIRGGTLAIDDGGIVADNPVARHGGEIVLQAGDRIALRNDALVEAVGFAGAGGAGVTMVTAPGGSISVDASDVFANSEDIRAPGGRLSFSTGRLTLLDGAVLASVANGRGAAGNLRISAGRLRIGANSKIASATSGIGDAGEVTISADSLRIGANGEIASTTSGMGDAGKVTILADSLRIGANGEIAGTTFGHGNAGNVVIVVAGQLSIDGAAGNPQSATGIVADSGSGSTGNGGDLTITAGSLTIVGGGEISSSADGPNPSNGAAASTGNAGDIIISVAGRLKIDDSSIFSNVDADTVGRGGDIEVVAGSMRIGANGEIASITLGHGNAGIVVVGVTGRLSIDGAAGNPQLPTGVVADSGSGSAGNAGDVTVTAGSLAIAGGGEISSSADGPDPSVGAAASTGNAGDVTVRVAGRVKLDESGIFSNLDADTIGTGGSVTVSAGSMHIGANGEIASITLGHGSAGNVVVGVAGRLSIDGVAGNAQLATGVVADSGSGAAGNAGDVMITAGSLAIVGGGEISSSADGPSNGAAASTGNAGDVTIGVAGRAKIDDASIFSNVDADTIGRGGGVTVSAGTMRIGAGGEIASVTLGRGNAGNVVVSVTGRLSIDGAAGNPQLPTGIVADSGSGSTGNAGDMTVIAGGLAIVGGGEISSSADGPNSSDGMAASTGNAGNVTVGVAGRLKLNGSGIASDLGADTIGRGGSVTVSADSLRIGASSEIASITLGHGNAGNVVVGAAGRLSIDGAAGNPQLATGVVADSGSGSAGNAGDVTVTAGSLAIVGGGEISSSADGPNPSDGMAASTGNAGDVTVGVAGRTKISGSGIFSNVDADTIGSGGSVTVSAGTMRIGASGEIASATFGRGNAGKVVVGVAGRLSIDGTAGNPQLATGVVADSGSGSAGNAGDVTVTAGGLAIVGGGGISSSANGPSPSVGAAASTGNAGDVTVDVAGRLKIDASVIFSNVDADTIGRGGSVTVSAGTMRIGANGEIASTTFGHGNAGSVSVDVSGDRAGALTILTGGEIAAVTSGTGKGGLITVSVAGGLLIDGSGAPRYLTGITSQANGRTTGNAGDVFVRAGGLAIGDDGVISATTSGTGKGGLIVVSIAGGLLIDGAGAKFVTGITSQADSGSSGNAGDVFVSAGSLSILAGGLILSPVAGPSTGDAGRVNVRVSSTLSIDGLGSQIAATAGPDTIGDAGSVRVRAGQISITDGGKIVSITAGTGAGGPVVVTTPGALVLDGDGVPRTQIAASAIGSESGPGGAVTVTAGSLTIEGGAKIASSTAGIGAGGEVSLGVSSDIVLSGPIPEITAQSTGSGDAGSITVSASRLLMNNGAGISTEAETSTANGGNIVLSVGDFLYLVNSQITTSVNGETGNGGDITIASGLVLLNHSSVTANAIGGNGGNIKISAGSYIASNDSPVTASSQKGVSGMVEINGIIPLNGSLVVLSGELRNPAALTRGGCAARGSRPQSSLVEVGRGGLPEDPNATLPALYIAGRDVRLGGRPGAHRTDAGSDVPSTSRLTMRCG